MMPRVLLLCITIVAAFPLRASAATPVITHVPVTTAVAALAERLGMDVTRDRGRFTSEIIRRIYSPPQSRRVTLDLAAVSPSVGSTPAVTVDIPLSVEIWSSAVFRRAVSSEQLLAAILADRRAALVCRGLGAADDETLAFYAEHPALLSFIYERGAGAFAAFADSMQVHDGHLVMAGGHEAEALWLSVAHVSPSDADGFLRALFLEPGARLAYLYDVLAATTPGARDFALGLWMNDEAQRARRFEALAVAVRTSYREWHVEELPFARPLNDLALLLLRVKTAEHGVPLPPAQRRFWAAVLDASPAVDGPGETGGGHSLVDAAWLLQATAGDMYARGDRLELFAFGQRVFGSRADAEGDTTASVLREMPTRRMLLLSLERMGIDAPDVYAAALHQSHAAVEGGGDRFWTLAQQEGALALLSRMSLAGSIDQSDTGALIKSLFAIPIADGELRGELAAWLQSTLAPHLPKADTWEARVIAGLAGGPTPGNPRVEWEGQVYSLDLAFAERRRIEEVRKRQGGPDLDVALAIARLGHDSLRATSADDVRPLVKAADDILSESGAMLVRPQTVPPGVPTPRDGREWLQRAAEDLDRGARANDFKRVARAADSIIALGDVVLGHAMLSLVYAVHLGDPEGPALLGANVALRHDFGFGRRDGEGRSRGPWAQPRQDFQPGVPWHVIGSLVGLDVALAPLSLHRLTMDGLSAPPRLQSIEREAFAVNAALLNARRLTDADRDRIVAAIARGRQRVNEANPDDFVKLKAELGLDGWRARTVRWVLQNEPASIENQFSLAELLRLGGEGRPLDAWGANGMLSVGCVCARFPEPHTWRILAGRVQLPMMAASSVEMNLEMAQRFAELKLPAALIPSVLATAMQDFVDQAEPADANDLAALAEYPRRISSNLMADYVAAAATLDGPLVAIVPAAGAPER